MLEKTQQIRLYVVKHVYIGTCCSIKPHGSHAKAARGILSIYLNLACGCINRAGHGGLDLSMVVNVYFDISP